MLPSLPRGSRWLLLFASSWLACGGSGSGSPSSSTTTGHGAGGHAPTTTTGSGGTTTSSTGTAGSGGTGGIPGSGGTGGTPGSGGTGGTSGSTSSSTTSSGTGGAGCTGAGGASSSSSGAGGAGGASSSSSSGAGGGGNTSSSSSSSSSTSSSSGCLTGTRLRVVAANLTTGNNQSWDPGDGIRILQGVHPDVTLMQEMNYGANSATDLQQLTVAVCGAGCVYARGNGQIPNGVVSRYPILASGSWTDASVTNRDHVWAKIDIPGPRDLYAVSLHLLTSSATVRNTEAIQLLGLIQANVPAGSLVIIGGDMNTVDPTEPALGTLSARFSTAAPYPADGLGNENTNSTRKKHYDWILASPELRVRETGVRIGAASFAAGLVVDTRVYTPIADLAPALVGDSGALNMQHMAVVRDFLVE